MISSKINDLPTIIQSIYLANLILKIKLRAKYCYLQSKSDKIRNELYHDLYHDGIFLRA